MLQPACVANPRGLPGELDQPHVTLALEAWGFGARRVRPMTPWIVGDAIEGALGGVALSDRPVVVAVGGVGFGQPELRASGFVGSTYLVPEVHCVGEGAHRFRGVPCCEMDASDRTGRHRPQRRAAEAVSDARQ